METLLCASGTLNLRRRNYNHASKASSVSEIIQAETLFIENDLDLLWTNQWPVSLILTMCSGILSHCRVPWNVECLTKPPLMSEAKRLLWCIHMRHYICLSLLLQNFCLSFSWQASSSAYCMLSSSGGDFTVHWAMETFP